MFAHSCARVRFFGSFGSLGVFPLTNEVLFVLKRSIVNCDSKKSIREVESELLSIGALRAAIKYR